MCLKGENIIMALSIFLLCSCWREQSENIAVISKTVKTDSSKTTIPAIETAVEKKSISELEEKLLAAGLINIRSVDTNIIVDLRYSTENNFLGKDVYGDFCHCYLQKEVAEKLLNAQQLLKHEFPLYNLLIFDCVRPRSVQWTMWNLLKMPEKEKINYVSNPKYGSLHNFGAAVDLTIAGENGKELDMGAPYDYFGELAYPIREQVLLKKGELTLQQIENRRLLRKVMHRSGFFNIQTEWWHFNSCYRKQAIAKRYTLIE